jgi:peptide/nickel transport system permease protein
MKSEAYLDIVWRQFRKNRAAYTSLWFFAPLFLMAIFAPVIASNQPFVFHDGDTTIYPWFRALFNPVEPVDLVFNMALVAFFPWLVVSFAANRAWKRRGMPGRRRLGLVALGAAAAIGLLCAVFGNERFRPRNTHAQRSFSEEQLQSGGKSRGIFPPIPFGSTEQNLSSRLRPPMYRMPQSEWREANDGFPHLLGTDDVGGDVLVKMIYGTRISLTIGFVAVGIYATIGILLGAVAGYFGGGPDIVISRLIEIVLLFPSFFLILTLVGLIGPSTYIIMVVIGFTSWPTIARLIRGEVLKQRSIDYVMAAKALGAPKLRIVFRHILPNAISPVMVAVPFGIADAIKTEAALSLLGFGVRPPTPSWGTLLRLGSQNYSAWWLVVIPSIAIFVTVTVFNLVGNGLRDAMDPRLRK